MTHEEFLPTPISQAIWLDRYALKDENGNPIESTIFDTFSRVAKAIALKEEDPELWTENFFWMMSNKYFCPAGRILAHAGTHYSQLLNCFVLAFRDDSLEEIMHTASDMALVQKRGGGTGFNYSPIRPEGAYVRGVNGRSCGVIGFLSMMSTISEVIEQGGSRRGANLGLLEVWHPDIWEFISYKTDHNWDALREFMVIKDEEKWQQFIYENQYKWQMYNVSVGVTDEFLAAVKNNENWTFRWRDTEWELYTVVYKKSVEGKFKEFKYEVTADSDKTALWKVRRKTPYPSGSDVYEVTDRRKIKASEIWNKICHNAWADGCPGLLNMSTIKRMHNLEYARPISATNPCITGETLVAVADGRIAVSIEQLAEEGKDVLVFCRNDRGRVSVRMMRHPRITGYNQKILKITIDGGHVLRVTENHEFNMSDESVIKASDLKIGDSFSIMTKKNARLDEVLNRSNSRSQDYCWINSTNKPSWLLEHRLIYHFFNPETPLYGGVIHHKDYNGLNNSIENLELMAKKGHDKLHSVDKKGDNNPMRRAQTEWGDKKWAKYRKNMSKAISGLNNGRAIKISNEDLLEHAVIFTKEKNIRVTFSEWQNYALENGLPSQFSKFRNCAFGGITGFLNKAAEIAGVAGSGLVHSELREYKRFLSILGETDLDIFFENGVIKIRKICEFCKKIFIVGYMQREVCFCSYQCVADAKALSGSFRKKLKKEMARRRKNKRHQLLEIFCKLKSKLGRIPMRKEMEKKCKSLSVSFRLPNSYEARTRPEYVGPFKNWKDLIEVGSSHNHRILSIEEDGFETVYNGTVDDYHNFYTGDFKEIQNGKEVRIYINNRQCGEQPLPAYSSCLLASLVLSSFIKEGDYGVVVNYDLLGKVVRYAVRFMDNVIDNCEFPLKEMEEAEKSERRIGLGTMGVHDMLIAMKKCYDKDDGRKVVEEVIRYIRDEAYRASIELAKEKGPFPLYDKEKYLQSDFIKSLPEDIRNDIRKYGIRNSCILSQAPTGTVGSMYAVSTGCEPWFSLAFQRNSRLGSYEDGCREYLGWKKANGNDTKPDYFKTAQEISVEDHIRMMTIFSKYIDSSVSKTINMSSDATIEDVKKAFDMAMSNGVKGVTVFRDGCKQGVLVNKDEKKKEGEVDIQDEDKISDKEEVTVKDTDTRIVPKDRGNRTTGATTRIHMHNHNVYITVNKNCLGDIVEVFTTVGESKKLDVHHTSGVEDSWAEGLAKIISLALRAGVKSESIIRNLKNIPSDKPVFATIGDRESSELIPSPPHAIARVMEEEIKYEIRKEIKNEDLSKKGGRCKNCGSTNIRWTKPTCYQCLDCPYSGCES